MMAMSVSQDEQAWLQGLAPGDNVARMLAGNILMYLVVTEVAHDCIICGAWEFSRTTGAEIDDELGWSEAKTGTYIRPLAH